MPPADPKTPTESRLLHKFTHIVRRRHVNASDLRKNLQDIDPALLLMSLVHIARDIGLLVLYGPAIEHCANASRLAMRTVSAAVRQEMIDLVVAKLDRKPEDQKAYLSGYDLDPGTFIKMASMAIGEAIDPKYANMFLEQTGFVRPMPVLPQSGRKPTERIELAIVGGGMTGLAAAIQAMDRGFRYRIFERSGEVGGVWSFNKYPGVAVDTPALYYSLSFDLNASWSNHYPIGREYLDYLSGLVDKYDMHECLELNSEVLKIEWIDDAREWELTVVKNGRHASKYRAAAVMTSVGHLNRPSFPDLEGRETFKGASMHANRWDYDVDVRGKRVGVIGTGATGVQAIAKIASEVSHLTVFQRQPMWIAPNYVGNGAIAESARWAREFLPYYGHWDRVKNYWTTSDHYGYPIVRAVPEWAKTHISISPANDAVMQMFLKYINACFGEGTELARKLTPNYALAGKRVVRDPYDFAPGGFYYAMTLPHVDLETSKLARVVPDGILTVDGKLIELDVIVYATGMTLDWLSPIEIIGRDGIRLADVWRDNNPSSYLGGMVPGFPNLFVNSGPHTGAAHAGGHNFMAEVVNHYALECLQMLVEEDARSIETTQEAHDEYNAAIDERLKDSIWKWERRAHTYYTNQKGRPILPVPWTHLEFWEMSRKPKAEAFILR